MLDELLKQSRASFRKTPRMESDLDLYSVYLDRSSVGEPAKRFEVNLYGGINGAWRVGSTIALLPLYKADGFSRKATKGHWRTFFFGTGDTVPSTPLSSPRRLLPEGSLVLFGRFYGNNRDPNQRQRMV